MLVEKTTKEFVLSEENKQIIKNNAQEIKNFLTKEGYYTCAGYFDIHCDHVMHTFFTDFEGLPFTEEEYKYFTRDDTENIVKFIDSVIENVKSCITKDDFDNKDDLVEHIQDAYDTTYNLINKIIEVCDDETLNKILNG